MPLLNIKFCEAQVFACVPAFIQTLFLARKRKITLRGATFQQKYDPSAMTLIYEPNKRLTPVERDRLEALACRANVPTETLIDCILRRAIIQDIIEKAKGSQPPQPQPEEVTR